MSKLSNIKLVPEKVPSDTFTKSEDIVPNSKPFAPEFTLSACPAVQ